jgi:hypothetical protein
LARFYEFECSSALSVSDTYYILTYEIHHIQSIELDESAISPEEASAQEHFIQKVERLSSNHDTLTKITALRFSDHVRFFTPQFKIFDWPNTDSHEVAGVTLRAFRQAAREIC